MRSVLTILGFSALALVAGCGVTLESGVTDRPVILRPGTPVVIRENAVLECAPLTGGAAFRQDVGGWVAMPEDHWKSVKNEILRLRKGEK